MGCGTSQIPHRHADVDGDPSLHVITHSPLSQTVGIEGSNHQTHQQLSSSNGHTREGGGGGGGGPNRVGIGEGDVGPQSPPAGKDEPKVLDARRETLDKGTFGGNHGKPVNGGGANSSEESAVNSRNSFVVGKATLTVPSHDASATSDVHYEEDETSPSPKRPNITRHSSQLSHNLVQIDTTRPSTQMACYAEGEGESETLKCLLSEDFAKGSLCTSAPKGPRGNKTNAPNQEQAQMVRSTDVLLYSFEGEGILPALLPALASQATEADDAPASIFVAKNVNSNTVNPVSAVSSGNADSRLQKIQRHDLHTNDAAQGHNDTNNNNMFNPEYSTNTMSVRATLATPSPSSLQVGGGAHHKQNNLGFNNSSRGAATRPTVAFQSNKFCHDSSGTGPIPLGAFNASTINNNTNNNPLPSAPHGHSSYSVAKESSHSSSTTPLAGVSPSGGFAHRTTSDGRSGIGAGGSSSRRSLSTSQGRADSSAHHAHRDGGDAIFSGRGSVGFACSFQGPFSSVDLPGGVGHLEDAFTASTTRIPPNAHSFLWTKGNKRSASPTLVADLQRQISMARGDSVFRAHRGFSFAMGGFDMSRNGGRSFSVSARRKSKYFVTDKNTLAGNIYSFGVSPGEAAASFKRTTLLGETPLCLAYMGKGPEEGGDAFVCRSILTGSVPFLVSSPSIVGTLRDDLAACCSLNNKYIQKIHTVAMVAASDGDTETSGDGNNRQEASIRVSPNAHIDIITEFYYEYLPDLKSDPPLTDRRLQKLLVRDLLTGLCFLYSNRKPHRHLTRTNVFKTTSINDGSGFREDTGYFVIGDIGMGHLFRSLTPDQLIELDHIDAGLFPPEVINGTQGSTLADDMACDLWALGVLLLTVTSGQIVHKAPHDVKTNPVSRAKWLSDIASGPIPDSFFNNMDDDLKAIVRRLVSTDPTARGKTDQILRAPYLRNEKPNKSDNGGSQIQGAHASLTLNPQLLNINEDLSAEDGELAIPSNMSTNFHQNLLATVRCDATTTRPEGGDASTKNKERAALPDGAPAGGMGSTARLLLESLANEMPIVEQYPCSTCGKEDTAMVWVCDTCRAISEDSYTIVCRACRGAGNYDHEHPHPLRHYIVRTNSELGPYTLLVPSESLTKHEQTFFTTFRHLPNHLAVERNGLTFASTPLGRDKSMALTPCKSIGRLDRTATGTFKEVAFREISIVHSHHAGDPEGTQLMVAGDVGEAEAMSETADSDCDSPQTKELYCKADRRLPQCDFPADTAEDIIGDCLADETVFELVLADMGLTSIPVAVYEPPILHVTVLDLCENRLTELPDGIHNLQNLQKLLLGNNLLSELPESIGNLCDLHELDVNHNQLKSLPQTLMFCDKLRQITIDYNHFEDIPTVIFDIASLSSLFLAANPIARWPDNDLLSIPARLHVGLDNEPRLFKYYKDVIVPDSSISITVSWNRIYPDYIAPNLYCGSLRSAQTLSVYEQLNIGYVLTMGRGLEPVIPEGMHHKTIVVDDIPNAKIDDSFEDAIEFIDESLRNDKGCLVHCFAGLSRSATAVIAYLMGKQGMRLDDAYMLTKKGRPNIYPNDGFFAQLLELDKKLFSGQRALELGQLQRGVIPT